MKSGDPASALRKLVRRMIVKICGITNAEDAAAAVAAGATALGFNFYPRSPRYIAPELAARIATARRAPRGRVCQRIRRAHR